MTVGMVGRGGEGWRRPFLAGGREYPHVTGICLALKHHEAAPVQLREPLL